ncbi:MAG: hypothetical protein CVV18_06830 [Gammaproteobacteria bacterium HGW-Gammaproteobacteria-8]|nr:MAG: hypothetical protein CVV18_06830 [Gammaproteobacteria bacterium HGW-Gammaproteobacteria-8]
MVFHAEPIKALHEDHEEGTKNTKMKPEKTLSRLFMIWAECRGTLFIQTFFLVFFVPIFLSFMSGI